MQRAHTIVHIDDSLELREMLSEMFYPGFQRDGVTFEQREDFTQLIEELTRSKLASAYILDNDVAHPTDPTTGAEIALKIYDKAKELGQEVPVVTILTSAPGEVRQIYGGDLASRGIPVLKKSLHAPFVGFYIGNVLIEEKFTPFNAWLTRENISLPDERNVSSDVGLALRSVIKDGTGGFFSKPTDFVLQHQIELGKRLDRIGFAKPGTINTEGRSQLLRVFNIRPNQSKERK